MSLIAVLAVVLGGFAPAAGTAAASVRAATGIELPSCAAAHPQKWEVKTGRWHPFRIWYQPGSVNGIGDKAGYLRRQLDDVIWPKEVDLMNTTPVAKPQDICLVGNVGAAGATGNTLWNKPGCGHKKATILVRDSMDDKESRDVLAHEFMHALQFSLDVGCSDTWWWRESTGQWAEDFVYKDDNREHGFAHHYLSDMDSPINDKCDCSKNREYGSYVFPFFIARNWHADLISQIWHLAQHESVLNAIDDVLPGGLQKQWPRFALDAWNDDPVDYWNKWDGLKDGAHTEYGKPIRLTPGGGNFVGAQKLTHMSVRYAEFSVSPDVRTVSVNIAPPYGNVPSIPYKDKAARVQALVGLNDGSIEVKDWSGVKNRYGDSNLNYCFALPHQHVTHLTLIFSNSDKTKDFDYSAPSKVFASKTGCGRWSGTIMGTDSNDGIVLKTTTTVTYRRKPATPTNAAIYVATGNTSYNWSGSSGDCTASGSGTFSDDSAVLFMHWDAPNSQVVNERDYVGGIGGFLNYPGTMQCSDGSHYLNSNFGPWGFDTSKTNKTSSDGLSISGSYSVPGPGDADSWSWHLTSSG